MRYISLALLPLLLVAPATADDSLQVGGDFRGELHQYLTRIATKYWTERTAKVAGINSPSELAVRQKYIREWLTSAVGGWPAKTPLNAKMSGGFTRDGYRVEHVVFESQPKYFVTANVYVPTTVQPPFPAVVGVAGHSNTGKAIETYQYAWIGMAKRGFLVIAFDPPGQGERSEYFDAALGKSTVGIGVREHNMVGAQCLLTGTTFARYEIWDGIRAFDYLLTRKDVDPKRIAVAGNSGGGTQSAYLAAMEPRFAVAAPSCYITSWPALWTKPGPQDAEQVFPGFVSAGLDFGDFLISFAPKPIMMLTAVRDFFPIEGARATYAEVKRVFEQAADAPGRAGYFEFDDTHGWSKPRREATYRWLAKWLQGKDDDGTEPPIKTEPEQNLNVTPTGQVATSLGGETTWSLNRALAESMYPRRRAARIKDPKALRALISERLNLSPRSGTPSAIPSGTMSRTGYRIEKLSIETEPGIRIPALLFTPAKPNGAATVYLNSEGKAADLPAVERIVERGEVVLAIDPRGVGESAPDAGSSGYSGMYQLAMRASLISKPLVGMQVYDTLRAFDYLLSRADMSKAQIAIAGKGNAGVIALFAGALEPRITRVSVDGAIPSYMDVVRAKVHAGILDLIVPGVLRDFDLPDLRAAIAPRPLDIVNPRQ